MRHSLQQAALELFEKRGYDQTTAADIATRAGVTERTFFRHFADKRDVLFGGETVLGDVLAEAVRAAPAELGPWDVLFRAFQTAEYLFVENRPFAEPRQRLIKSIPALQERALAKTQMLIAELVAALRERGLPDQLALLVAKMGAAALSHAVACWFDDDSIDLHDHLVQAFQKVRDLSSAGSEADPKAKLPPKSKTRSGRA